MCKKLVYLILIALVPSLTASSAEAGALVGHWEFEEAAGNVAHDSSGNGNDGRLVGGPQWVTGKTGGALEFDGVGSMVDIPYSPDMTPLQGATISCWVFPTDSTRSCIAGQFEGYGMALMDGLQLKSVVWGGDWVLSDVTIPEREWSHLTMTWDVANSERMVFLNGELVGQRADSTVPNVQNNVGIGLWVGWPEAWGDDAFMGVIDDVWLHSRVLTAGQVLDLFNGVPPSFLKAERPLPADGALGVTSPLFQWGPGDGALFHDVYLSISPQLTEADLVGTRQPFGMYWHIPGLEPGVTYYWRVDEIEADMVTVHTGDVWSFTAMPLTAYGPSPADGGDGASQAPTLSWLPGQGAMGYHLYFGDSFDAVKDGAAETDKGDVAETTLGAGLLRAGTTYYWRVDETDSAGGIQIGEVWSFTTGQPVVGKVVREWWLNNSGVTVAGLTDDPRYPGSPDGSELLDLFEGPTDWSDNYGCRLYGWLVPPESGDYTFWIASDDGSELWLSTDEDPANGVLIASVPTWVPARDFDNTGGGLGDADAQKSDPIALAAGAKYYIEALMNEGGGGDNIAVAWQVPGGTREVIPGEFVNTYALPPLQAATPSPENGAVDTIQSPILSWFAGENAVAHHLYFGDDADAVAGADTSSPEYKGQQAGTTYNPSALEWGKSYAWRVDEEEADGTVRTGAVWGFTTAAFLLIEDFESYTDNMDDGEAIFQTWIDGWDNGTGSTVGYLSSANGTFGETTVVYTGKQSMPLDYNNVNSPYYSETSRMFAPSMNLTAGGMDTLTLYVRGQTGNDPAPLYVGLESGATRVNVTYGDDTVVQSATWVEVGIPLADFAGVNAAAVQKMYISLGNPDAPTPGGAGLIYVDDIRATRPAPAAGSEETAE